MIIEGDNFRLAKEPTRKALVSLFVGAIDERCCGRCAFFQKADLSSVYGQCLRYTLPVRAEGAGCLDFSR